MLRSRRGFGGKRFGGWFGRGPGRRRSNGGGQGWRRGISRSPIASISIIAVCSLILAAAVTSRPQAGHWCPCGVGAAYVAATGASITAFTVGLTTELYLVLWSGFGAIKAQVDGNTGGMPEISSYQTQVYANVRRQRLAHDQTMNSARPATAGFSTSASSGAGAAELNTDLVRDAILQENYEHQVNMTEGTEGRNEANAAYWVNRRLDKYCSRRDAALDRCDLPEDERLIDADVDASVIEQETLDEALVEPAIDRCRNLAGHPSAALTANQLATPIGQVDTLNRAAADSRALLSFAMCDYLVALRTELPEDSLKAWADEVLQRITGGVGMMPPPGACSFVPGFNYTPTVCTPFSQGSGFSGPDANVMNQVYSHMIGHGFSHEVAFATAITTRAESAAGRNMIEDSYNSTCHANPNGPTVCSASEAWVSSGSLAGRPYVPTGIGIIQFSGWPGDSPPRGGPGDPDGWGRGADLVNAGFPIGAKCTLASTAEGGCGGSEAQAIINNLNALMLTLPEGSTLRNQMEAANDIQSAADVVTRRWIRPHDMNGRVNQILASYGSGSAAEGTCSFSPNIVEDGTDGGDTGVIQRASLPSGPGSAPGSGPGGPTPPAATTGLVNPMGNSAVRQTDCFGYRNNRKRRHSGIDLSSASPGQCQGLPIYAAGDGELNIVHDDCVEGNTSGNCGGYGNFITITHIDGTVTTYGHMETDGAALLGLTDGQQIRQGQQIGTCGNTGDSRGAHLDFGVRLRDGTRINPHAMVANLPANNCAANTTMWYSSTADGSRVVSMDGRTLPPLTASATYENPVGVSGQLGSGCATADLGLNIEAEHISHLQLMKMVSEYRMQDPGWIEFVMTKASRPQLVREFALVEATQMYLRWQSFERQVQTAGVVAAWAAAEAERTFQQTD